MIYVLIPFGVFAVFSAVMIALIQRNIRLSTRMHGIVTGKRYVPTHGSLEASGSGGGRAIVVPDSWVLDIDDDGRHGHAVVSEHDFERIQTGDEYPGNLRIQE